MEEQLKDWAQIAFSFFVAGYLLIVFHKTLTKLEIEIEKLRNDIRQLIMIFSDPQRKGITLENDE